MNHRHYEVTPEKVKTTFEKILDGSITDIFYKGESWENLTERGGGTFFLIVGKETYHIFNDVGSIDYLERICYGGRSCIYIRKYPRMNLRNMFDATDIKRLGMMMETISEYR